MTDADINLAIAMIEYPEGICQNLTSSLTGHTVTVIGRVQGRRGADYCNNWSDIGPIIEREKIELRQSSSGNRWAAVADNISLNVEAETPKKAAALCYLKMKGVELC